MPQIIKTDEDDLRYFCLRADAFKSNLDDFTTSSSFERGDFIGLNSDGLLSVSNFKCNDFRFKGLCVDFRFFIAQSEASNFLHICKIINKLRDNDFNEIKKLPRRWQDSFIFSSTLNIDLSELTTAIMNGQIFHANKVTWTNMVQELQKRYSPITLTALCFSHIEKAAPQIDCLKFACEKLLMSSGSQRSN